MQLTLIDPLVLMPEDTIFADIDNKAALVPCDSSGVTTAEQWVEAHVSMYLGNVPQTISAIVCKIYDVVLGPDYTNDPAPSRYFRAEQTPATGYVKVYIKSGTGLTAPTTVIITVTAIIDGESVSRNVAMNICGSLKGNDGKDGIDGIDGNDGDDAERYWIELEGGVKNVKFREDFAGGISGTPATARIILKHLVGSEESELAVAPSGYAIEYLADNNEWELIDTADGMTRLLGSDLSDGAWSPAVYRLRKGSTELMRINVYAEWEYQRMLLPAGIYTSREYTRTPTTTPLVLHESSGEYWFLAADTNKVGNNYIGPKDANQGVWQKANDFDVVLTRMLFAQFAQLGGFIVYDNFFFSRYGTLVDASGNETVVGQANVSLQYAGRVPYGWFSPSDPMASAAPDSGYRFRPSKCINALTGEEWAAGGNIHFSPRGDISVKGAMMSHKVKLLTKASQYIRFPDHPVYVDDYWSSDGMVYLYEVESNGLPVRIYEDSNPAIYYGMRNCKLLYDQVYIGSVLGDGKNVWIYLPPPHLFIGQRITITNMATDIPSNPQNGGVFVVLDYMYYTRTDYSEGICLTGQEAYFEDDGTGEHDNDGVNGMPYIVGVPERDGEDPLHAAGIWTGETIQQGGDSIFCSNLKNELNIGEYEWIELTSVQGPYWKYKNTDYWEETIKYNAYWMLTRWQKKRE